MKSLEDLQKILRTYQAAGLSLEDALDKLFREHGVICGNVLKRIDEKDDFNLGLFIEFLGKKDTGSKFKQAVDEFANEEKRHPVQKV
jgi:hypothetical protein